MVITTIQVSDETRKKLQVIKQNLNLRNVDEVINKPLKIDEALELSGSFSMGEAVEGSSPMMSIIKTKKTKEVKK